jgi:hypothetical protein
LIHLCLKLFMWNCRGSIITAYRLTIGFDFCSDNNFLFVIMSRSALGSTQPPSQCVSRVKRQPLEADLSSPSSADVRNAWNNIRRVDPKHRDNFTFTMQDLWGRIMFLIFRCHWLYSLLSTSYQLWTLFSMGWGVKVIVINSEYAVICEEVVVKYFKVESWHLPGGTKEDFRRTCRSSFFFDRSYSQSQLSYRSYICSPR